jgi:retron-type reverse transcriptase
VREVVGEQVPIDRYYTLRDKIVEKWNMHEAAQTVIAKGGSGGIDGVSTEEFNDEYELNMRELYRQLQNGSYQPSPVVRVYIPKSDGSERPLGVPTVKDRIAQASVKEIIEPIYEEIFCDCSYGFRPGRSQIDAIKQVEEYREQGYK